MNPPDPADLDALLADVTTTRAAWLAAWRDSRDPGLAEAIALLSRVDGEPGFLDDIALLDRDAALVRLTEAQERAPDPRWTPPLLSLARCPPASGFRGKASRPVWDAVVALLDAGRDPRAVEPVKALFERTQRSVGGQEGTTWVDTLLHTALRRVLQASWVAEATEESDWTPFVAELAAAVPASPEGLYAAVWQAPDDTDRRAVLADRLQELDDPRGEHIALQLVDRPSKAQKARIKELHKAHWKAWLGAIAPVVKKAVFVGGFADALTVDVGEPRVIEALADAPEWSTVRALTLRNQTIYGDSPATVAWLCGPRLRRLRSVAFAPTDVLACDLPLEALHLQILRGREFEALLTSPMRPATLAVEYWGGEGGANLLPALLTSPLGQAVSALRIESCRDGLAVLAAFLEAGPTGVAFRVGRTWSDTWGFELKADRSLVLNMKTTDFSAAARELNVLADAGLEHATLRMKRGARMSRERRDEWAYHYAGLAKTLVFK